MTMLTLVGGGNYKLLHKFPAYSFSGGRIFITKCCGALDVNSPAGNRNLIEKTRERITNDKVEISPSAYDTAWVAMVPATEYSGDRRPCFPQCLDWIMENQNADGSWGLDPGHPFLIKDRLSCTLACVLALTKWGVGQQLVQNGMDFIASNGWAATNNNDQFSPIGFDIMFPWMVNYAKELDLTLPSTLTSHADSLRHIQDPEIRRKQSVQVYALEGLGKSCNWKGVISEYQKSNGSLFNSPATTAAALIHCRDEKCFEYLISVLNANCSGWVPTIYPMDIYTRLCVVDTLEKLGVSRYFEFELRNILDEIYGSWLEKRDEIFSDITCRAMAFRLLRINGYDVSSDEFAEFVDQEHFFDTVGIQYGCGVSTVLELYRASQARICDEAILDKIHDWTSAFLKQQLLNQSILDKRLRKQVEYDLKNFYGTLDQFGIRRSIELYDARHFQILKTAYRCTTVHNEDFILFSVQNFRISQSRYQEELQQIERWYDECRLDRLHRGRKILRMSYVLTAAIIVGPELSLARIFYAQAVVLTFCLDDFFDLYGSREEAFSIIELVSNWKPETNYCSQEVEILFTALYKTVNEVAEKAYDKQGCCIKDVIVSMWLEVLMNFAREKDSWNQNNVSTLDEYLSFAWKSIGCNLCVFTSIHFLGIKISQDIYTSTEYTSLCEHSSLVCRLLNDLKTFKREHEEGVLNSVSLQTLDGGISEEDAILKVEEIIEYNRRKVLQMVYKSKGSIVPRECKELFWKACEMAHCLYSRDGGDEFSSQRDIANDINGLISEPL
ncbi:hypothetical protein ABFS83_01G035600 [Erythranthe nasuta]